MHPCVQDKNGWEIFLVFLWKIEIKLVPKNIFSCFIVINTFYLWKIGKVGL